MLVDNNKPLGAIPWINIAENNNETKMNSKSVPFFEVIRHDAIYTIRFTMNLILYLFCVFLLSFLSLPFVLSVTGWVFVNISHVKIYLL